MKPTKQQIRIWNDLSASENSTSVHNFDFVECGYDGCKNSATMRNAKLARCPIHGGHHDFTEKLIDQVWTPWTPVHSDVVQ